MAGALDALGVGSALFDVDERILACCPRFAALVGRPLDELVGVEARDLVKEHDQAAARFLMAQLRRTGESFTIVWSPRRHHGDGGLVESYVQFLKRAEPELILAVARPFTACLSPPADSEMAEAMAGYVVDMTSQMVGMAARAAMPVMCDLLRVAVDAGRREGGLGEVATTSP